MPTPLVTPLSTKLDGCPSSMCTAVCKHRKMALHANAATAFSTRHNAFMHILLHSERNPYLRSRSTTSSSVHSIQQPNSRNPHCSRKVAK